MKGKVISFWITQMLIEKPQRLIALAQTKFHADPSEVVDVGPRVTFNLSGCYGVFACRELRLVIRKITVNRLTGKGAKSRSRHYGHVCRSDERP
jgi:hypothetical protein